jgi:arylsulfatase A-like enzyme
MADDLAWQDTSIGFGLAPASKPKWRTPHLQALADEGAQYAQAYASAPVCTPTRVSLITGQSVARHGVTYWTLNGDTSAAHPTLKAPAWRVQGRQPSDGPTLPRLLAEGGYRTIHAGKAHWGAIGTPGADPISHGFQVNIAGHAAGAPGSFLGVHNFTQRGRTGQGGASHWDVPGLEKWHGKDVFLTEALAAEAIDALRADRRKPFFLHFAPYAVHTPIMANSRLLGAYEGWNQQEAAYGTMIESLDNAVGAIREELRRQGRLDNTLFVFTSDNGGLSAHSRGGEKHRHNLPAHSGKGSWFEGGVRAPLVVSWPGRVRRSLRQDAVWTPDLTPTLLQAAGLERSIAQLGAIDGRTLPGLGLESMGQIDREMVWHQPHFWGVEGPGIGPYSAIRRGPWKLVAPHDAPAPMLYNLNWDIGEERDLAPRYPALVRELSQALGRELREAGASMSIRKETGQPVPFPGQEAAAA